MVCGAIEAARATCSNLTTHPVEAWAVGDAFSLPYTELAFAWRESVGGWAVSRAPISCFVPPSSAAENLYFPESPYDTSVAVDISAAPFVLYGRTYTTMHVGANGYVAFGATRDARARYADGHPATRNGGERSLFALPAVVAFRADLYPQNGGGVCVERVGAAWIITWWDLARYGSDRTGAHVQATLHADSRNVTLRYMDAGGFATGVGGGGAVAVGNSPGHAPPLDTPAPPSLFSSCAAPAARRRCRRRGGGDGLSVGRGRAGVRRGRHGVVRPGGGLPFEVLRAPPV